MDGDMAIFFFQSSFSFLVLFKKCFCFVLFFLILFNFKVSSFFFLFFNFYSFFLFFPPLPNLVLVTSFKSRVKHPAKIVFRQRHVRSPYDIAVLACPQTTAHLPHDWTLDWTCPLIGKVEIKIKQNVIIYFLNFFVIIRRVKAHILSSFSFSAVFSFPFCFCLFF